MNRKAHFLTKTVGTYRPSEFIFFDCETAPTARINGRPMHVLKVGVAKHCRVIPAKGLRVQKTLIFYTPDELADFVCSVGRKHSKVYLISHNIAFDLLTSSCIKMFNERGFKLNNFYSKETISIFEFGDGSKTILGLNNANFYSGRLEKLAKIVGMEKGSPNFQTATLEDLIPYCENDVDILIALWQNWIAFLDLHDMGSFKHTLASTSFNAWRYRFMKHKVYLHNHALCLQLEEESYHGGRVTVFRRGRFDDGDYYKLDVNSMYPHVLRENKYPVSMYRYEDRTSIDRLSHLLPKYGVIASVLVRTSVPSLPFFGEKRLVFPTGEFVTCLTTPELKYALKNGLILDCYRLAYYQMQPIFVDFVDYFYSLRLQYREAGNDVYAQICKIILNALYGKFAQRAIHVNHIGDGSGWLVNVEYGYNVKAKYRYKMVTLGNQTFEVFSKGFAFNAFPAVSSHVTAHARMKLWELITLAGLNNVFYTDTDSLMVNEAGFQNLKHLIHPDRLGALKVEEITPFIEILAPKHYRTAKSYVHKGIREKAILQADGGYQQPQFASLAGMIKQGSLEGVVIQDVVKYLNLTVPCAAILEGGFVLPPAIREGVLYFHEDGLLLSSEPQTL